MSKSYKTENWKSWARKGKATTGTGRSPYGQTVIYVSSYCSSSILLLYKELPRLLTFDWIGNWENVSESESRAESYSETETQIIDKKKWNTE